MKITIVGAGLGNEKILSINTVEIIKNADIVIATDRLYEEFKHLNKNSISIKLSKIKDFIEAQDKTKNIVVLASGDVGFYSLSKTLKEQMSDYEIEFVSGISSLQYLTAKLQISYDNIKTVSVHGRENSVIPTVCYTGNVFVLTGGKYKASDVIDELISSGLTDVNVTIGENLSYANERIITDNPINLQGIQFENLSVMLIENKLYANKYMTLKDCDFLRSTVPMTKEEVRNISLCKLNIMPTDVVYDVGAGTGSVTISMGYKANKSFVYAVEKSEKAVELIKQNIKHLKAYNVKVISGTAPQMLNDLPAPNKVFIGGSGRNMSDIFDVVLGKNPNAKIVVNAITLETLNLSIKCFEDNNISPEIICVNVANAEKIGGYNMMKSQNPIYIISGEKE